MWDAAAEGCDDMCGDSDPDTLVAMLTPMALVSTAAKPLSDGCRAKFWHDVC